MAEAEGYGIGGLQITQNDILSHGVDLFEPTRQEKSVLKGAEVVVLPMGGWKSSGPFKFELPSQSGHYVQLGTFRLRGECRIIGPAGEDLVTNDDPVGIINNFPASLFNKVEISINGTTVTDSGVTAAHYKSYIETVLTYGADARSGHLDAAMFLMDAPNQFDNPIAAANRPFATRRGRVQDSRIFDWEIPLNADFLRADRYLPPGNDLKIELTRNPDALSLLVAPAAHGHVRPNYKIEIRSLKLYYRQLQLHPGVETYHMKGSKQSPFVYPINRTSIQTYDITHRQMHGNITNMYNGHLPKSIVVGMVRNTAFNGDQLFNPYNFQHFNCNFMQLKVKGTTVPSEAYTPDFHGGLYAREFNSVFQNCGIGISNQGNCFSRDLFAGGLFLVAFDLSPDNCNGFHQHAPDEGSVSLEIKFAQALVEPIVVICYAVFDVEVRVGNDRQITSSYLQ